MIRSFLLRALAILAALFAAIYILDTAIVSHKAATNKAAAFGSVQVYLATPTKGSRLEIFTDQPESVTCVHALFPHYGDSPCWYVSRHTTQQID
ncbi:MAG TPA: hypothetical protein VMJ93_18725 [Verrucomicrobiae bacterium]|nr:hypothetical protein [Verrucomicrobiae bacterium]